MKPLDLSPDAPWRRRFYATDIHWGVTAEHNPDRGLVCTNKDGIYQLYAWDVPSGWLVQVTHRPAGGQSGIISPDGNEFYYLKDEGDNEIGHFVRVPLGDQICAMFAEFATEHFQELDEDGTAVNGPKHWHVFTVIAHKRQGRANR